MGEVRYIQRISNSSAKGSAKTLLPSPLLAAPHHVFVRCHMSSLPGTCAVPITLALATSFSFPKAKHLLMAFRNSAVPGKGLHPHYLWVLWPALPFVVFQSMAWAPSTDICQQTKVNTQDLGLWKPFQMPGFSISSPRPDNWDKCPQNPLICVCMFPLDCLTWFWMLALLSECVTCHEWHRRKDIKIPTMLTCWGLTKKRVLCYLGNADFFFFLLTKQKLLWGSF